MNFLLDIIENDLPSIRSLSKYYTVCYMLYHVHIMYVESICALITKHTHIHTHVMYNVMYTHIHIYTVCYMLYHVHIMYVESICALITKHTHIHTHIMYNVMYTHMYRLSVLQMMATSPPFTRKTDSKLNTLSLVERIWNLIWYSM